MADMVVSPLVDAVMGTLVPLIEKAQMTSQVGDDLDALSNTLSGIQDLLADAEARHMTESSVKKWLRELKDVAYDADDVLDEVAHEALRQEAEAEAEGESNKRKRKWGVSSSISLFSNLIRVPFDVGMEDRIKNINERIAKVHEARVNLSLTVGDGRRASEFVHQRPLTSSFLTESELEIIGRDKDREEMIKLLLSDDGKQVSLISIVGMGGLGKTTLAQLVYNDRKVENYFQIRAWVCVSEDFDVWRLTKKIVESATRRSPSSSALDPMQRDLEEILSGKRFLVVLDDVWNENRSEWERLRAPFSAGAKGSKIIVTTRGEAVSKAMITDHLYRLEHLGDENCLTLFLRHAFAGENSDAINPELKKIGKELVERRCQGLPLAAKTVGGLLSLERDFDFWRSILNNPLWSSFEDENEIMKALRVSYHHLPPHIKHCFAVCSIFPKDHEFKKDTLVQLWMAQGFVQLREGITLEETGSEYFDFLLSRSFFQLEPRRGYDNQIFYKMHDCIHDLTMSVSSDECFRFEHGKPTSIPRRVHRHSSFFMDGNNKIVNLKDLYECKGLRTFIIQNYKHLNYQILSDLIMNLRCLRFFVLRNLRIEELPGWISNLKHLRYLDLHGALITQLPASVSSLCNLQTLDLGQCSQLCQLPKETRKLVNLKHLNLDGCWSLKSMPPEMGRLTCLQTLPRFIVGRESGCGIGELKGLTALKGAILIEKLSNVSNANEAKEANIKDKPNIKELGLEWDDDDDDDEEEEDEEEEDATNTNLQQDRASLEELSKILEALQPHTNIRRFSIKGYGGKNYPNWLQGMMLPNLESFITKQCTNCNSIPPLGRLLKSLHIEGIPNLEEWCEPIEGEFPFLESLCIIDCPKLTKMPNNLSTLKSLYLQRCHQLACFPKAPSLDELRLVECNEILLRWVPHLTSLSTLIIRDFKELKSLPKGLWSLTSLKDLTIASCPQLLSLPEEGLPTSLQDLYIRTSDKLSKRCRKGDGEDWAKISYIPHIFIGGEIIS